jgi:predicted ATPase
MGEPAPIPELPPPDAQRRFQLVFRQFIGVFARPEHPLALFLDDLQGLDAATLDLLEDLLSRSDLRNLLLIGAFRDNEVTQRIRSCGSWRRSGRLADTGIARDQDQFRGATADDAIEGPIGRPWQCGAEAAFHNVILRIG